MRPLAASRYFPARSRKRPPRTSYSRTISPRNAPARTTAPSTRVAAQAGEAAWEADAAGASGTPDRGSVCPPHATSELPTTATRGTATAMLQRDRRFPSGLRGGGRVAVLTRCCVLTTCIHVTLHPPARVASSSLLPSATGALAELNRGPKASTSWSVSRRRRSSRVRTSAGTAGWPETAGTGGEARNCDRKRGAANGATRADR